MTFLSSAEIESNEELQSLIRQEISQQGPLSFSRFMELALYTPKLGYYAGSTVKLGRDGDFVTAPELSPLFSRSLARQCEQVLKAMGGDILEVGAGTGQMAMTILLELEQLACLPHNYYIYEISADLRQRQQALLSTVPHLAKRVTWLDQLPANFAGVVLANEVLDAFPVHRFRYDSDSYQEYYVDFSDDKFTWLLDKPQVLVSNYLESLQLELAPGYVSECNLYIGAWLERMAALMQQGVVLIIDYGFPRHEYYHPDRSSGTLMCHYQHQGHDDPLILVGQQDITTHVDFTQVAIAASECHFKMAGYTNQANFLLAAGITNYLSTNLSRDDYHQLANQIKILTSPNEMGELFKVMALTKNYDAPLIGFALRDLSHRL